MRHKLAFPGFRVKVWRAALSDVGTLAPALRPVGKTPDRDKKTEQKQYSWHSWRLVAADMVENCEQHDGRETGCGGRAEPRRHVNRHWQDDAHSTGDFRETD